MYWLRKVSVANRMVAPVSSTRLGMILVCSGEGCSTDFMPPSSGRSAPAVRPKQWKVGSGLKSTSSSRQRFGHVREDLMDVGDDVAVGEDDALGVALGAGGEEDDGRAIRVGADANAQGATGPRAPAAFVVAPRPARTSSR